MIDKPWLFRLGLLADDFWKMSKVSLLLQEKHLPVFLASGKSELSRKIRILENVYFPCELDSFHILKGLSIRSGLSILMINKCDYLTLCNEISQSWEDLHTPANKTLPNDQCILQNYEWVKYPFKVWGRPVNFKECIAYWN